VISNFLWRRVDWAVNAPQRAYAYAAVGISAISNLIICAEMHRTIDSRDARALKNMQAIT
jgi:hypothetical protein